MITQLDLFLIKYLYKSGITEFRNFRQSDQKVKSLFYYQRHSIRPADGSIAQSASQTRGIISVMLMSSMR
jgi:hypothetical protein